MPAPGGPARTSDQACAPHCCWGRGGQARAAQLTSSHRRGTRLGAVPGAGVSLWKGPWAWREAGNPLLKPSTICPMCVEGSGVGEGRGPATGPPGAQGVARACVCISDVCTLQRVSLCSLSPAARGKVGGSRAASICAAPSPAGHPLCLFCPLTGPRASCRACPRWPAKEGRPVSAAASLPCVRFPPTGAAGWAG